LQGPSSQSLHKLYSYADAGVLEDVLAFNSDYFAAFYPGKLPFLSGQGCCAWEIELHQVAWADGGGYRYGNEDARFADVCAFAVDEPVSFGQPDTYGPVKNRAGMFALLDNSFHIQTSVEIVPSIYKGIGNVNLDRLAYLGKNRGWSKKIALTPFCFDFRLVLSDCVVD
jgi:hypothetical protein